MIIKDQNGNEIDVEQIVFESDNDYLNVNVKDGKIHIIVNNELLPHDQFNGLNGDDHKQYLDAVRHADIDHSGTYAPPYLSDVDDVLISIPATGDVLTYVNGIWMNQTPTSTRNHNLMSNLDSDDHPQYAHNNIVRIITAAHVYDTGGAAFVITGQSIGKLIRGLNADMLNGKSSSEFAAADHTHVYVDVAPHTHRGLDILTAVNLANNALALGGKTADQYSDRIHTHVGTDIISRVPDSALIEGRAANTFADKIHTHDYAPVSNGVTGGDNHDHNGITKRIDHTNLTSIGQKTHAEIDSHVTSVSNPHLVTKNQIGLGNVDNAKQIPITIVTAKGDLVAGTGPGAISRFSIGTNGYILIVDNTQPTGLRWASVASIIGGPYALATHAHDYAPLVHTHNYAPTTHDHDSVYLKLAGGVLSGNLYLGGNTVTGLSEPSESSDAATKAYVDSRTSGATFTKAVISIENDPPGSAAIGDRYIVGTTPTGVWALYANYIAQKTLAGWNYVAPINGMVCPVDGLNQLYTYDTLNGWYVFDISNDHGSLSGLSDDDHPQYASNTRDGSISAVWTFTPEGTNQPFYTNSTRKIENLNAHYLNGLESSAFALVAHTHIESNRTVLKYLMNDGTWDNPTLRFAPYSHSHDTLYFTKTQLQTSGSAAVHWGNITNVPLLAPASHATSHQNGGSDKINVAGLSGLLADAQTPLAHLLLSHTAVGLTPGYFLKALTATTFGFVAHGLTYADVGAAASSHNHNTLYSSITHDHNAVYSLLAHTHSNYSLNTHDHAATYAPISHSHANYALTTHDHAAAYAPIAKGVTNGDSHDHAGGDGSQIAHANLSGIGTNTHSAIDSHIANASIHRTIDDNSITTTNLWSASKISSMFNNLNAIFGSFDIYNFETGTYDASVFDLKTTAYNGSNAGSGFAVGITTSNPYSGIYCIGSDSPSLAYSSGINGVYDANHAFVKLPDTIGVSYTISMNAKRWKSSDWGGFFCGFGFGGTNEVLDIAMDNIYRKYVTKITRLSSTTISVRITENGAVVYSNASYSLPQATNITFGIQTRQNYDNSVHFRMDNVMII